MPAHACCELAELAEAEADGMEAEVPCSPTGPLGAQLLQVIQPAMLQNSIPGMQD